MVETAAGVVEEVGKRVVVTAASMLEKAGVDVTEVERRLGGEFPPSAKTLQTLAGEAVTAGLAGVDLAVGVARNEAEKVFEKVGDQVTKVGVVLAYLESKLREVEEETPAAPGEGAYGSEEPVPAPRADDLFGRGWEYEDEPSGRSAGEPIIAERVEVDAPVEVDPPVPPAARFSPTPPEPKEQAQKAPARKTAAKKAAVKKAAVKKAAAKKAAPAGDSAAEKTATPGTAAGKAAAEKAAATPAKPAKAAKAAKAAKKTTTVKKTASAGRGTAAAQSAAQPKAPAKRTATRKTTVRKATSVKKPDAQDE
ncbi:hypothetical protein ACIRST_26990 [Kitasatospora sp. NPDC101447]|uniref:hypothetical protein n=1 Tax=Kitasatospora sp. NPDC101447 TaxID=3364102 RepID=UPI0037F265C8